MKTSCIIFLFAIFLNYFATIIYYTKIEKKTASLTFHIATAIISLFGNIVLTVAIIIYLLIKACTYKKA